MKVTLLSIIRADVKDTFDATFQIGQEQRVFRFVMPLYHPTADVGIFEIISDGGFAHLFRYYAEAYGKTYQLIGQFHQGKPLEFPVEIGDYDVVL